MPKDTFPKREVSLIEAASAPDAVTGFMARESVAVDVALPVRGSALLHGWFLSGKTMAGDYIDGFVDGKRRSLSFKAPNEIRYRILSVEDWPKPTSGGAGATEPYQQQATSD